MYLECICSNSYFYSFSFYMCKLVNRSRLAGKGDRVEGSRKEGGKATVVNQATLARWFKKGLEFSVRWRCHKNIILAGGSKAWGVGVPSDSHAQKP
jgi:hypothetical protein